MERTTAPREPFLRCTLKLAQDPTVLNLQKCIGRRPGRFELKQ